MASDNRTKAEINAIIGGASDTSGGGSSGSNSVIRMTSASGTTNWPVVVWDADGAITVTTGGSSKVYSKYPVMFDIAAGDTVIEGNVKSLNCRDSGLTALDISGNSGLLCLDCYNNDLTELELLHNEALERVDCCGNAITALNLGSSSGLRYLNARCNKLTAETIGEALEGLSECCGRNGTVIIDHNAKPSEKGAAAIRALNGYGWHVTAD